MTELNQNVETAVGGDSAPNTSENEWRGGSPPRPMVDHRTKSPVLAMVLSLMPGLGQIYIGYYKRGFAHILVVASVISFLAAVSESHPLVPLFGLFLAFFWLYNVVDAGRRASLYNGALVGEESVAPPSDFEMPGRWGAAVGGVLLIGVGGVLLSNTLFGISLDWVDDWWPAALFIPGIWLVVRSIQERSVKSK